MCKTFAAMAKRDEAGLSYYELNHLFDHDDAYAPLKEADESNDTEQEAFDAAMRAEKALDTVTKENINQLIADNREGALPASPIPSPHVPGMAEETDSVLFEKTLREDYDGIAAEGRAIAKELADLSARIAQPLESLSVPRWAPRLSAKGARLNPRAMAIASVHLATGSNQNIWQRIRRTTRPQRGAFDGLDVFSPADASFSMMGDRAHYAAAAAIHLIEGLELAYSRRLAERDGGIADIRNQIIALGEGWIDLKPASTVQDKKDKQAAFRAITFPSSNQTIVGGALAYVDGWARESPDRELLRFVVSDGLFADNLRARKQTMNLPQNTYVGHINIGRSGGMPLSPHYETLASPSRLPRKATDKLRELLDEPFGFRS